MLMVGLALMLMALTHQNKVVKGIMLELIKLSNSEWGPYYTVRKIMNFWKKRLETVVIGRAPLEL
jgi:hypothetical protein